MKLPKMPRIQKHYLLIGVVLLNSVLIAVLAATSRHNRSVSQATLSHIGNATEYVCNTTNILDVIVKQAYTQLETNFKLGEYTKLEKTGVLTKHDIALAHHNLVLYKAFDKELQKNKECQFTVSK